jgi:hypothetical protein
MPLIPNQINRCYELGVVCLFPARQVVLRATALAAGFFSRFRV